ncbi:MULTISPECIES: hypothetical protein [unclassified Streptomyces]|uniref:hypothetical protein n=1 Tax=unclassified Streptomyces TaxID=2593676 RepID=UPI0007F3CF2D|nr:MULTISPECIES: hypothetical protein [unclassified Streptomyces]MCM1975904.1 hypothetical protein [Streptomyces sp. G1]SBT92718.1 hypothetical protein GA0115233_104953 [Streptomyces sp. DI166]
MRALPARRIAVSALSATLLLGIAGPAASAVDDSARERTHAVSAAPVPGADALLAQTKSLGDLGGVLTPVTDLLNAVLKADNGQLSAAEAEKLGQAVKDAIAKATAAAPVTPPVSTPELPTTPQLPTTATLPVANGDNKSAQLPADLVADALAGLQKEVDALLAAAVKGDLVKVTGAVSAVLTSLVNVVAATLLGAGLPAPTLPGLPQLPSLPNLPGAPELPSTPELPVGGGLLP